VLCKDKSLKVNVSGVISRANSYLETILHTFIRLMDSKKQKPDTETERQTEKDTIGDTVP